MAHRVNRSVFLLCAGLLAGCGRGSASDGSPAGESPASAASVEHVAAAQAAVLLKDKPEVVVLDVRTPGEFKAGHLPGATNLDYKAPDFRERLGELDKSNTYLIHCATGRRSTASLKLLSEQGITNLYHLDGGFVAWEKAGNPVER